MKTLGEKEGARFHRLFDPLLSYAYANTTGRSLVENYENKEKFIGDLKKASQILYTHPVLIRNYIHENKKLSSKDRRTLRGFNKAVIDCFAFAAFTEEGGILIQRNGNVYLVKGILSSWEDLLKECTIPLVVETAILPFNDCIITDGLIDRLDIAYKPQEKEIIEKAYHTAEKENKIIRRLE